MDDVVDIEFEIEDRLEARGRELGNSQLLDVHTWSESPEVNGFVDALYLKHFAERKKEVGKRHLKVLLLDLYLTWTMDPKKFTAFGRSPNYYNAKSRYNELNISRKTINVVDTLIRAGLLEQALGFHDRRNGLGRLSRIRPTPDLQIMFLEAKFGPLDISNGPGRLAVELRDEASKPLEYQETEETVQMEEMLARYNEMLSETFIDIPAVGDVIADNLGAGLPPAISNSPRDKFIRRIFNRQSFEFGGRFTGGWWQNCLKDARQQIFLNDAPSNEVDFSGLHIVMLYAIEGICYWDEVGVDPYKFEYPAFLKNDEPRATVKALALVCLNARSRKAAFAAFRDNAAIGTPQKRYTNVQLNEILDAFVQLHPRISHHLNADVGIRLMRKDSDIAAIILSGFAAKRVPILSLHDSFVVPCGTEDWLRELMHRAFEEVMGVPLQTKGDTSQKEVSERIEDMEGFLASAWQPYPGFEHEEEQQAYKARLFPFKSTRYLKSHARFQEWVNLKNHRG